MIRQTGRVPTVDTFTFGAEGHQWVDLHWLFQVLLSWGFDHGGVVTLNLAKCGITTLAVFLLVTSKRREWPTWAMLLAWLPAVLVLGGRMYIRPETISLLYFAIVLAVLFRWERRPWLAFALPMVQACWVNTQGLFVFGPILIAFALVDAASRPGAFARARRGWWRTVGLAAGLTGLACLFNPYGLVGALYPIQLAGTMGNPIFKNTIGELKPLPRFIEEVGLDSLPLQLHIATFVLGLLFKSGTQKDGMDLAASANEVVQDRAADRLMNKEAEVQTGGVSTRCTHSFCALAALLLVAALSAGVQGYVQKRLPARMAAFAAHPTPIKLTGNILQAEAFHLERDPADLRQFRAGSPGGQSSRRILPGSAHRLHHVSHRSRRHDLPDDLAKSGGGWHERPGQKSGGHPFAELV